MCANFFFGVFNYSLTISNVNSLYYSLVCESIVLMQVDECDLNLIRMYNDDIVF